MVFIGENMLNSEIYRTIDLVKLEEIKKWCEYRPLCFITNSNIIKEKIDNYDCFIKNFIEYFYFKFNIKNTDKNNHKYRIKIINKVGEKV